MNLQEFLDSHYPWLIKLCKANHSKFGGPIGLSIQDMAQEAILMLPNILQKYEEYTSKNNGQSCSLNTFVWNRIRGKFRDNAEIEFKKIRAELEQGVEEAEESALFYDREGQEHSLKNPLSRRYDELQKIKSRNSAQRNGDSRGDFWD